MRNLITAIFSLFGDYRDNLRLSSTAKLSRNWDKLKTLENKYTPSIPEATRLWKKRKMLMASDCRPGIGCIPEERDFDQKSDRRFVMSDTDWDCCRPKNVKHSEYWCKQNLYNTTFCGAAGDSMKYSIDSCEPLQLFCKSMESCVDKNNSIVWGSRGLFWNKNDCVDTAFKSIYKVGQPGEFDMDKIKNITVSVCNGHGIPSYNGCTCEPEYEGELCDKTKPKCGDGKLNGKTREELLAEAALDKCEICNYIEPEPCHICEEKCDDKKNLTGGCDDHCEIEEGWIFCLECDGFVCEDKDASGICDFEQISGCTDSSACNHNPDATNDDGSCAYLDCIGDCGGSAVLSGCDNQCGSTKTVDCAGTCGGSAVLSGCDNQCGSTKTPDCAGTCGGNWTMKDRIPPTSGDQVCCPADESPDCKGVCGGDVFMDCKDVCGGNWEFTADHPRARVDTSICCPPGSVSNGCVANLECTTIQPGTSDSSCQCSSDDDCWENEVCSAESCISDSGGEGAPCETDLECVGGYHCDETYFVCHEGGTGVISYLTCEDDPAWEDPIFSTMGCIDWVGHAEDCTKWPSDWDYSQDQLAAVRLACPAACELERCADADSSSNLLCENTCATPSDGFCDDGGTNSYAWFCDLGTDCADCGPREDIS